jgi:hypothetical protein
LHQTLHHLVPYPYLTNQRLSRTWHLHQKTASGQRCPVSPASASPSRAATFVPCCSSSHPVGGLVTRSAALRLDTLATEPPGHGGSLTRFTTTRHACTALARSARALALDVATTARTQCATKERPTGQDHRLWALHSVCSDLGFAHRLN